MARNLELLATLWPSFPHFHQFAHDKRLTGIRLNSAMIDNAELATELKTLRDHPAGVPLYFDIKGRQLRVTEWHENPDYLDISINHKIAVPTPIRVLFKAGADSAILDRLEDGGSRLIFRGGPHYHVKPGESLQIRHPGLKVFGDMFTKTELEKIDQVHRAGFTRYFLSYAEHQRDVDELLELVGRDSEIMIKIENKKGLEFTRKFRKRPNLRLVAARGDLYVEIDRPHQIMDALKLIIQKDPEACAGSRIFLSLAQPPIIEFKRIVSKAEGTELSRSHIESMIRTLSEPQVPACADFLELAWLYDIGYRSMMLCDEICLREDLLDAAVDAFSEFRKSYTPTPESLVSSRLAYLRGMLLPRWAQ
jgi:pyruvate kinase